jgi:molecular chaperone DnaK (HSP70)
MLTHSQGRSETVTIASDQGRLTREEVERMIVDAEKYAEDDKATAARIANRNALENYAFNLKNQLNDADGLGGRLDDDGKETVSIDQNYSSQTPSLMCSASRSHQGDHRLVSGKLCDRFD